jgi:hypothetical protein
MDNDIVERRRALIIMETCETCRPKAPDILSDESREGKLAAMCPVCAGKFSAWIQETGR